MDGLRALDFATKHKIVADRIVSDLAEDEILELGMDLMAMYSHSARRQLSHLGWLSTVALLHEIRERSDHWPEKHAAQLVLAHQIWEDSGDVDADLRQHGAEDLATKWHTIGALGRTVAAVAAIPALWNRLLPQLGSAAGQDLLEHFVLEEMSYDDE
jgi:hypothetical protein